MNWLEIFDTIHYGETIGASNEQIEKLIADCSNKLNNGKNVDFPDDYIDFLKFCNTGVTTMTGERELQFFTTENVVKNNLDYGLDEFLPGAISFAMDGSGHQLFFDFRTGSTNHKIYIVHSSDLDWNEVKLVANNFIELCKGTNRVEDFMYD